MSHLYHQIVSFCFRIEYNCFTQETAGLVEHAAVFFMEKEEPFNGEIDGVVALEIGSRP
jgi:hypothetical protein